MYKGFLLLPLFTLASLALAAPGPRVNIFPKPSSVAEGSGTFHFSRLTIIEAGQGTLNEARFLREMLSSGPGGIIVQEEGPNDQAVSLKLDESLTDLGDEGYTLSVRPDRVEVRALKPAGIFYAIQTIRQLLPAAIENPDRARRANWSIPCVEIKDRPRFAWRGLLLDVSRHFFPKPDIEHILDLLAMLKMNTFHWHLVDDGGWRIEIKKYPKLTQVGAWRKWTPATWDYQHLSFPGTSSGERVYGGFYTQDDIREIVRYAAERHITIVPEIEMPGHSLAAMESYPQLTCSGAAPAEFQAESGMPFPNVYCAGKETTFKFLEDVLDEVCDLFPSQFIHIGGDEVDKFLWQHCPDDQKRMQTEGLKSPEELQSYFIRRIENYLNSKGRRLIGWDEILEGGLAPNATVMSWRGIDGGIAAAQSGHDVVMTPTSHCYFDYSYQAISTEHAFEYEPVPTALTSDQAKHVLGAQCNLWTEWVPDIKTAEERLFPRIISISEDTWSESKDPDVQTFIARLQPFYSRLDALGLNYYIPKPVADYDAVLLNGPADVTFQPPPMEDASIHFTEDGSVPTLESPVYRGAIRVSHPETITAATFKGTGAVSDPVQVSVSQAQTASPAGLTPGLAWKVADGKWQTVPNFDALALAASGTTDTVALVGDRKENYAIQLDGYIKIDREGVYTFSTSSDDGSVLWIGGAKVVNNDTPHGAAEAYGRVLLHPGIYPFRVGYFQLGGGQSLSATIEGPGVAKQAIPAGILFH